MSMAPAAWESCHTRELRQNLLVPSSALVAVLSLQVVSSHRFLKGPLFRWRNPPLRSCFLFLIIYFPFAGLLTRAGHASMYSVVSDTLHHLGRNKWIIPLLTCTPFTVPTANPECHFSGIGFRSWFQVTGDVEKQVKNELPQQSCTYP